MIYIYKLLNRNRKKSGKKKKKEKYKLLNQVESQV